MAQHFPRLLLVAAFLAVNIECRAVVENANIAWLKGKDWPEAHMFEQLSSEENLNKAPQHFHLITYLPRITKKSKTYCQGIINAIWRNIESENIEEVHLFRHDESCIHENYLPQSSKIVLHKLEEGQNMTLADIMKFVAKNCEDKNVILARANMYLPKGINIFSRIGIKENEVHILKSEHSNKNDPKDTYYGTHYAFIFKGQWDMIDEYPHAIKGLDFEIDSPNIDSENVLKRMFEVNLQMTLIESDIKAICLHE